MSSEMSKRSESTFVRILGQGGCGKVSLIFDGKYLHAIKECLQDKTDAQKRQFFERECDALSRCRCMSIVRLLPTSDIASLKLDLEFVPGGSLGMWLKQLNARSFLTPTRVHIIFYGVARAINAVHEVGLAHRDIKPGNVLLTPAFEPKLCDFGFARVLDDAKLTGVGTPFFTAPEIMALEPKYTPAVDLYSFGRLMYAVLTGDDEEGNVAMDDSPYKDMVMELTQADPEKRMGIEEAITMLEQVERFADVDRAKFDDYKRRFEAYKQEEDELCTPEFLEEHEGENAAVRYYLAILYSRGVGKKKDEEKAKKLVERAADEGLRMAAELYVSQMSGILGLSEEQKRELEERWSRAYDSDVLACILDEPGL